MQILPGTLDDGGDWDDGGYWGGWTYLDEDTDLSTDFDLEEGLGKFVLNDGYNIPMYNLGHVPTLPRIMVVAGAGTVSDLMFERRKNDIGYERIRWSGTLQAGESLLIDCGRLLVNYSGSSDDALGFGQLTVRGKQRNWLQIDPGLNKIRVSGTFTANATLYAFFEPRMT